MAILGEVFSIIRNGASIKQIDGANGFPITRIETISNRVIDRNRLGYANVFDITEYESYVLQSGDILMSHINSEKHLGKTALYIKKGNEKIIHGMNLLMLRANSEVILPLYAKYFFDSNLFLKQIPNITKKSVNQASFTVTALKKLEIKIPKMVEQKRIIDIMSRLDNIIQYRKDQLEKLDLFVKSRFIEMFGDPQDNTNKYPLASIIDVSTKVTDGEHGTVPRVEIGRLYLMARNITKNNNLDLNEVSYIPEEYHKRIYERCNPEIGDVLLVCVGATIGKATIVPEMDEFSIARSVALIKPDKRKIKSNYLLYSILSNNVQCQIANCSHAAAQAGLYTNMIKNLKIILPPIDIQNQFADFVAKVDKSKLAIQQSLDELETLKKSLMQQYFG